MYMHKGHTYILKKTFSGHPFRVSATDGGSVYSDADSNNIEIGSDAGSVTFEVPQNAPDKLYYYCTSHASNMKGLIYTTTDGATSGYFESRVDTNAADIVTVSGLTGGGGGGAVSAVANGADNRIATFSSSDALNGEANLTFDGSTLTLTGHLAATTKSFLIDHPTKEGMKLQYGSLEGPENGVYVRGTSGSNIITLPEYWSTLVDQSTVTVSLTPVGYYQALYIAEKGKNYIKVGGAKGSYDYVIYGERKDVEKLKVEW